MNKKIAVTFPGQGSQSVGMLADLASAHSIVQETFAAGSDAVGVDLWALSQAGPKEKLNETQNTQPALLCAGIAVLRVLQQETDLQPSVMAGHSLGEYTALVAAGVLELSDAARLVALRGRFMQEAVPAGTGAMAAILGLDDDRVRALCAEGAQGQVAEAVNFNSPGQVVVAGNVEAVTRVAELAKAAGAKRALLLDVSVPSHCALMRPAAQRLAEAMRSVPFAAPRTPVLHNVNVEEAGAPDAIRQLLVEQLYSPVRWVETVQAIGGRGVQRVIEAGPGKVLAGLIKRIDKTLEVLPVFDPASLQSAVEAMHA
ncbi:MAG: ACP S-malonyltransferase [Chromatiaceae bacterium]|nr:ACP S-malonyltransferase [Gammaproteobacteria bacterium]MCP5306522.1 ACP S-malonyltransferase [Chromatiaceae bacterium]MCP5312074.1 ACP S-malonyltransferase [Chromatiaceae bacterium]